MNKIVRNPITGKILGEGLIQTVDPYTAKKIIIRDLGQKPYFIKCEITDWEKWSKDLDLTLKIIKPKTSIDVFRYEVEKSFMPSLEEVLTLISNLGYFPSGFIPGHSTANIFGHHFDYFKKWNKENIKELLDSKYDLIKIILKAKFDNPIKPPKLIYHSTSTSALDKIKKIGLKPSTQSKKAIHPERIYFALDSEKAKDIDEMLTNQSGKEHQILVIDTTKINVKFYKDPDFIGGIYTHENIPPQAIIDVL